MSSRLKFLTNCRSSVSAPPTGMLVKQKAVRSGRWSNDSEVSWDSIFFERILRSTSLVIRGTP
jgi:hypothetical protein